MPTRFPPQEVERQAAQWAARRCAGLSAADHALFEAWLAGDLRHLGAYAKAEAVLAELDRAGAAGADALRPVIVTSNSGQMRRRTLLVGSVAAGLTLAAGTGLWLSHRRLRYSTGIGETREVMLSDGSLITLNTNSSVEVQYDKDRRHIQLLRGEALFDVAKNKARPFIVAAGDTQVRAVGTSFTVSLLPQAPIRVLVREGVVEVTRPQTPRQAPVRVAANSVALAPPQAPIEAEAIPSVQVSRDMAWREGRLAFDNVTLADAARQFARYSAISIQLAPDLENQTVTGLFVSTDPVGFARAVAISMNLQMDADGQEVRLHR